MDLFPESVRVVPLTQTSHRRQIAQSSPGSFSPAFTASARVCAAFGATKELTARLPTATLGANFPPISNQAQENLSDSFSIAASKEGGVFHQKRHCRFALSNRRSRWKDDIDPQSGASLGFAVALVQDSWDDARLFHDVSTHMEVLCNILHWQQTGGRTFD
jgi:hypothetical protein